MLSIIASLSLPGYACRRSRARGTAERLDVTPSVRLSTAETAAGRPVSVRYRWDTGPAFGGPGVGRPLRVFAHFITTDGAILIVDDHAPEPAASQWQPGRSYEYTRVVFTHHQFPGPLDLHVGLYDPEGGARPRLMGDSELRPGVHRVATLKVARQVPGEVGRFVSGFLPPWAEDGRPFESYRWMSQRGIVFCRNPRADAVCFLRADAPASGFSSPPVLTMAVDDFEREHALAGEETFTLAMRVEQSGLAGENESRVILAMNEIGRAHV